MEFLMIVIAIVIAGYFLFKSNTERGKRFVRAFVFLESLNSGGSVETSNGAAEFTFSEYDNLDNGIAIRGAKRYANSQYGGKQLPVIREAIEKGFVG